MSMIYSLYRAISFLIYPLWFISLRRRIKNGKESPERYLEKLGRISIQRPHGKLIWFHAVSVGEINIIIPLIKRYHKLSPNVNFLITTITVTSAEVCAKANIPNSIHQYLPIDVPFVVNKFFNHWKPDLSIFTESELWPNLLWTAKKYSKVLLINGRLSDKSFKKWKKLPKIMSFLLKLFDEVLPGTDVDLKRFSFFYDKNIHYLGNLKNAAPAMSYNRALLDKLRYSTGDRQVVVYASTHRGEEEMIMRAHQQIKHIYPDFLTIIVPRHIDRTAEILRLAARRNLNVALYTNNNHEIHINNDIYIANVIGELGTFYRLADIAFVGGSFVRVGGHNTLEPAKLGLAVIVGPHTFNFSEINEGFLKHDSLLVVNNEKELVKAIKELLSNPEKLNALQKMTLKIAKANEKVNELYIETITRYLS